MTVEKCVDKGCVAEDETLSHTQTCVFFQTALVLRQFVVSIKKMVAKKEGKDHFCVHGRMEQTILYCNDKLLYEQCTYASIF